VRGETEVDMRAIKTLGDAAAVFVRQPSAKVIGAALIGAIGLRTRRGRPTIGDPLALVVAIGSQPLTEWILHRIVLHARPKHFRGRLIDTAAQHRVHHDDPDRLDSALLGGKNAALDSVLLAGYSTAFAWAFIGRRRGVTSSTLVAAYTGLLAYEWTHFLIHTGYRPKRKYYARLRTNHRLHHYRNEFYWLGVTSNFADRLMRTLPGDKRDVPLSPTARTLGADTF
jgi:sterol desaturase/sphingolipid hydroxylase (fatty acid hydroxylase superfamily)